MPLTCHKADTKRTTSPPSRTLAPLLEQDVQDERFRTEAEFFQYVSQVRRWAAVLPMLHAQSGAAALGHVAAGKHAVLLYKPRSCSVSQVECYLLGPARLRCTASS